MKPLYERYRLVKQMLTRASITPVLVSKAHKDLSSSFYQDLPFKKYYCGGILEKYTAKVARIVFVR